MSGGVDTLGISRRPGYPPRPCGGSYTVSLRRNPNFKPKDEMRFVSALAAFALAAALQAATATAQTPPVYYCDPLHIYSYPGAPNCPVPWRAVAPMPFPNAYPGPNAPGNAGPEWDRLHPVQAQQRREAEWAREEAARKAAQSAPLTADEAKALKMKQEIEKKWIAEMPTAQTTPPGDIAIFALLECTSREMCTSIERFADIESCRKEKRDFDSLFPKDEENYIKEGWFNLTIYVCVQKFIPTWQAVQ